VGARASERVRRVGEREAVLNVRADAGPGMASGSLGIKIDARLCGARRSDRCGGGGGGVLVGLEAERAGGGVLGRPEL
jgi:hypothetical protein